MAHHVILNGADTAHLGRTATGWSPLTKLCCFIGCAAVSWAVILAPFYLIG